MTAKTKASQSVGPASGIALQLALDALHSEAVQEQLRRAPAAVKEWAAGRGGDPHDRSRLNPASRYGSRGLARRVTNLKGAFALVFGERAADNRPELWQVLDELENALAVAHDLPVLKRKRVHRRVDDALDKLELGLVEAVFPK